MKVFWLQSKFHHLMALQKVCSEKQVDLIIFQVFFLNNFGDSINLIGESLLIRRKRVFFDENVFSQMNRLDLN